MLHLLASALTAAAPRPTPGQVVEAVELWVHLRNAPYRRRWADEPPPRPPSFPVVMVRVVPVGTSYSRLPDDDNLPALCVFAVLA